MKHVLIGAALVALAMAPAWAHGPSRAWVEQSVGQEVFSLKNTPVGRLDRLSMFTEYRASLSRAAMPSAGGQ
jgi:hypothetical protein